MLGLAASNLLLKTLMIFAILLAVIAISNAEGVNDFEVLDDTPTLVYANQRPYMAFKLAKRALYNNRAMKRERIIMDALGGDYLVRKRSL
uniref:Uncharacterized protein n=1 Tax=Acrobeloides nanus TaxID=290746 RepID=A0A914DX08_9BILA